MSKRAGSRKYRGYSPEVQRQKMANLKRLRKELAAMQRAARKRTKMNSSRKPKSRTVSLRNFTGKVRLNPDKSVSILGVGRKKKAKAKTRRRK